MRAVAGQIDVSEGLQQVWNTVVGVVPLVVLFVLILIAGFAVAALASAGTMRLLRRIGFDRAVERGGIGRALASSRFDATDLLARVIFYGLLLLTAQLAFGVFGDNPVSDLLASVVAYLPRVFVAIVIMVVAAAIGAGVRDIVSSALGHLSYGPALATASAATIVTIGAFAALDQLEVAPAIVLGLFYALLAVVAGSAIVAIGGAGIQPMRAQWERVLRRVEDEAPRVREGARQARQARADERARRIDLVAEEQALVPDATPTYVPAAAEQPGGAATGSDDGTEEFRPTPSERGANPSSQ